MIEPITKEEGKSSQTASLVHTTTESSDNLDLGDLFGETPESITSTQVEQLISGSKTEFLKDAKEEAIKLVNIEIQKDKSSMITVFGIFASIISFLTIDFQFLKTICDPGIILSFTFILFGMLICFNLALDSLVSKRELK